MYTSFFEDIKPKSVKTLDELDTMLEKRPAYTTELVNPSSIMLGDDGLVSYNGKKAKMSLEGFRQMVVKLHRIPDPFAQRIPLDLLQHNLVELGKTISFPIQFVFNEDGLIINAVKDELKKIATLPLSRLFRTHQVKMIRYSDYGVQIQTINPVFCEEFEPKVGDPTGVGVNFNNSETGFWDPKAETLIWQLACSNGAIMSKRFGQVKVRIKRADINEESIARTFEYKLAQMLKDAEVIPSRMREMCDSSLTIGNAATVFKSAGRITSMEEVSEHLNIDKETIKDIKAKARLDEHKDEDSNFNAHDIYSGITNLANDYNDPTRRQLQVLGGKILEFDFLGGKVNLN